MPTPSSRSNGARSTPAWVRMSTSAGVMTMARPRRGAISRTVIQSQPMGMSAQAAMASFGSSASSRPSGMRSVPSRKTTAKSTAA